MMATEASVADDDAVASNDARHDHATPGSLSSLARKLQHPLVRIRARALTNLLFKLREGLVKIASEPPQAVDELAWALVQCLADADLESTALQVLQLVLPNDGDAVSRVCAPPLRRHGAAAALQRGATQHAREELQSTYESLLHRLLASTSTACDEMSSSTVAQTGSSTSARASQRPVTLTSESESIHTRVSPTVRVAEATVAASAARHSRTDGQRGDPLTTRGWKLPTVPLAAVDDQFLFELEVKWRLRSTVPDLVAMCDTFRCQLLRDFPPQVFLERPAMLLRVLELVRQPIIPAATTPELSFGVNYFDEPSSRSSFVWKPSISATALHVSSLKALESWLAAVRYTTEVSLNPMYHVFPPASLRDLTVPTMGYDHRQLHYPRTAHSENEDGEEGSLSMSGAAYLLTATLLQLLTTPAYPHLQLLNVVHAAVDLLPERSVSSSGDKRVSVHEIEKQRVEALLAIVGGIVTAASPSPQSMSPLVKIRLLEWIVRVFRLHEPSSYRVEGLSSKSETSDDNDVILIPSAVWTWVLRTLAEDDSSEDVVKFLDEIHSSASQMIDQLNEASRGTQRLEAALVSPPLGQDETGTTRGSSDLPLALRMVRVFSTLAEHQRQPATDFIVRAMCSELKRKTSGADDLINRILRSTLHYAIQTESPHYRALVSSVFDILFDWVVEETQESTSTERLASLLDAVSVSDELMQLILCTLAGDACEIGVRDALWRFTELILRALEDQSRHELQGKVLGGSVAILQHFAYADPNVMTSMAEPHRRLQRTFVRLIHQIESTMADKDQLLLISRCLLHRSPYIRKAAAAGLFKLLASIVPEQTRRVTSDSVAAVDPFGQYATGGSSGEMNQRRVLDDEIPSLLHPQTIVQGRQADSSTTGGSSVLHRVSRLRKLASSMAVVGTPAAAEASALHQLLIDIVHASKIDLSVLQEAGEVEELMDLVLGLLWQCDCDDVWPHPVRRTLLAIVRVVLARSSLWRDKFRRDTRSLSLLLTFVYDESARVRAVAYFIVLALSCSAEMVVSRFAVECVVLPAEFETTFGMFASRWPSSGVDVRSLQVVLREKKVSETENDKLALSNSPTKSSTEDGSVGVTQAIQDMWDAAVAATSYRTFLDAIYQLIHACRTRTAVCVWVGTRCEHEFFRRYLDTPPTSEKDHVVMAAILALVSAIFHTLSKEQQMTVVLLLRRSVIPVQLTSKQMPTLSAQLVRLLLHVSKSKVADMFVSLLVDTGLHKRLSELILSSSPLHRALWIDVVLAAVDQLHRVDADGSAQHLIENAALAPLQAIAGRHRVPGSFQERDIYVRSVECLSKIESTEDDVSCWRNRLIFDCSSTLRAVGFRVTSLVSQDHETINRLLRLAVDTMREEAESDAVRSSAAQLIFRFIEKADADAVAAHASAMDAVNFVSQLKNDLASSIRTREKCSVRLNLTRVQLLRLVVPRRDTLFGESADQLLAGDLDDYRSLAAIVEVLSLRRAIEVYQCHNFVHLGMYASEDAVWRHSLLPVVLTAISETAQLFQMLVQSTSLSNVHTFITSTPLLAQLVESVIEVADSLQQLPSFALDGDGTQLRQCHYTALDEAAKLLSVVMSISPTVSLPSQSASKLVEVVAFLLKPTSHPKRFRLSFSRLVAAILTRPNDTFATHVTSPPHAMSLGESLWMTYHEICQQLPMDPELWTARASSSSLVRPLRRAAFVLQVLLSKSPETSSSLCGDRYSAVTNVVRAIKMCFTAIRMAGGFGAKSNANEAFLVELCSCIQLHCHVLSGFMASSSNAQTIARLQQLPSVLATHWNVLRLAHRRGSSILVGVLRLVLNYVHSNNANKGSLVAPIVSMRNGTNAESERNLLGLISDLALGPPVATPGGPAVVLGDPSWGRLASAILKSAFLLVECLHGSIKTGLVTKLFARVVEASRRKRQTAKPLQPHEELHLIQLLGVLASVASSDDGRQVLLQLRDLKDLVDDVLHFSSDSELLVAGALFVRNMAFSKFSKSHFAVWEPTLHQILTLLNRGGNVLTADHLSTALVCFVVDNQRAQSVLQASAKSMTLLRDASRAWKRMTQAAEQDQVENDRSRRTRTISANLERVEFQLTDYQAKTTAQP